MLTEIPYLELLFDLPLSRTELPAFRGAIHTLIPQECSCFHNHEGEGLHYAYPLIQYRLRKGKASIVGLGRGVEQLEVLLRTTAQTLCIGRREVPLELLSYQSAMVPIGVGNQLYTYRMEGWLPLNGRNYSLYQSMASLRDRIALLDAVLVGNLLSCFKGLGIVAAEEIVAYLTRLENIRTISSKKTQMMAFDVAFESNVLLPPHIGLGKSVSRGFGVLL